MSNVTLRIGGRSFTVACAPGEEAHVGDLGRVIDGKVSEMDGLAGQNEGRMLLFASLLLADELHEARSASVAHSGLPPPPADGAEQARLLDAIATRLENLAARLEG